MKIQVTRDLSCLFLNVQSWSLDLLALVVEFLLRGRSWQDGRLERSVGDHVSKATLVQAHADTVSGNSQETDRVDHVTELSRPSIGKRSLHGRESGTSSDTHNDERGTTLGPDAEVRGGQSEGGRVAHRLEEEDDEERGESRLATGQSRHKRECGAHGTVHGENGGIVEEAEQRRADEATDHEGDLHVREHLRGL